MTQHPLTERRGAPRAPVFNLSATEYRGQECYKHPMVYLSKTGMLIRDASFTLDRLMETQDVDLEFQLPGVERSVRVPGRIVRVEPTDDGELGVGIEFINLAANDAEAIDSYVAGVRAGAAQGRLPVH